MEKKKTPAMAIVGLVLAIIGLLLSAVPIINNFAFVLAILGIIFGIVGLTKTKKNAGGKGVAISAIIISVIAFIIVLVSQQMYGAALDEAVKSVDETTDRATGEKTDDLLKNDVDVKLGKFKATKDQYGIDSTVLPVTVTNKLSEKKSYSIHIEAVDKSGSRIADDYVNANDLGANQTQQFKIFQYVESDKLEKMKSAEFKIVTVSEL